MVKLNRIYTRTGDDGTTGLGTGGRTPKDSLRVEAYGEVDEANAALGLAALECERTPGSPLADLLKRIQQDMFDLGADLCIPIEPTEKPGSKLRIVPDQTAHLESLIDQFNDNLAPLTSFVLPGGTPAAAALHLARTIVRRAERRLVTLHRAEPARTNPETIKYVNRLSDLLFVLARIANDNGTKDVLWVPGVNRPK